MLSAMTSPWAASPHPGMSAQYGFPPVNPAYHPVQTRHTFAQAVPVHYQHVNQPSVVPLAQLPETAPPKKKIDWPPAVRAYVQRSFNAENIVESVSRPEMESKLKETISAATEQGTLHTLNWDRLPLPQEMIASERHARVWQQQPQQQSTPYTANGNTGEPYGNTHKRKSQEMGGSTDEDPNISTPPWRVANNRNEFEDRISYQSPKERHALLTESTSRSTSKFQKNLEKRQRRFDGGYKSTYAPSPSPEPIVGPVVGTCQELEKRYFRLTAPPIPSKVRPEHILRQTLELLKQKWKKEGNYSYICDQFKSLRQDLTVQRIKNDFTVDVYEIHARIALEKGDLGEYNQCQTQLRALYKQIQGGHPVEFKAYRILYFIHTSNRTALNDALADLTPIEMEQPPIKHALDVRSTLALGDYHRFFRLYLETPHMGAYLMDMFVVRERLAAISKICKSYKPDVKLRFITEELGFESDQDAAKFILDHDGHSLLVEKDSTLCLTTGKAGILFEEARSQAFSKIDIKGQI